MQKPSGLSAIDLTTLAHRGKLSQAAHGVYRCDQLPVTARAEFMLAVLWTRSGVLRETLGAKLVAYLGGVRETRAVREWAEGTRTPSSDVVLRLRTSFYVMAMLRDRESASTVASWFQGMNPELNDVSPARVLREQEFETAGPAVLAAARSFAAFG